MAFHVVREACAVTLARLPCVSLQTQRMVKVEALIRWEDPERGLVSPGEFIPALEETGLIVPVGTWVLEEACRQAKRWQEAYADRAPLAVTLSLLRAPPRSCSYPTTRSTWRTCRRLPGRTI